MAEDPPEGERKKASKGSSRTDLIGKTLQSLYDETASEPIPEAMLKLLGKLDDDADKRGQ